ncbi:MAG: FAD-dependent thymidylate synthase [Desulfobulbaceae bacterium]|nr:FAD-dependent thymidylate synthase [Desulfobulbaceae bacterium]
MIVIPQSYDILVRLDKQNLAVRIENCYSLCHKSESVTSKESTSFFIGRIFKENKSYVAEMAVLTLKIDVDSESLVAQLFSALPKYLHIDKVEKKTLLISGSVRAFRELFLGHGNLKIVKGITQYLGDRHPLFFEDILPSRRLLPQEGVFVEKIPLSEVETFSSDLLAKHRYIAVKFTVNRAVAHEMVRHRPCGFLQESQRYCRYSDSKFGSQVTFIKPLFYEEGSNEYKIWEKAMLEMEKLYTQLLETSTAQAARTVLPNSCKTELIVYANLLQWLHMFKLRTSKGADPSMREVMIPLLDDFKKLFPAVFAHLTVEK